MVAELFSGTFYLLLSILLFLVSAGVALFIILFTIEWFNLKIRTKKLRDKRK